MAKPFHSKHLSKVAGMFPASEYRALCASIVNDIEYNEECRKATIIYLVRLVSPHKRALRAPVKFINATAVQVVLEQLMKLSELKRIEIKRLAKRHSQTGISP